MRHPALAAFAVLLAACGTQTETPTDSEPPPDVTVVGDTAFVVQFGQEKAVAVPYRPR